MGILSFLFRSRAPLAGSRRTKERRRQRLALGFDTLEDRRLLSGNTISGFVFNDANNNGLLDPGESAIVNSSIELRNANNVSVGSTLTNSSGAYEFSADSTISTAPTSATRIVPFAESTTDWTQTGTFDKFDPSLGTLTSIDVLSFGSITSAIKVENTSQTSASMVTGNISGTFTLTGPGISSLVVSPTATAGSFSATIFDGVIDFGGTSGKAFAATPATGNNLLTITDPAILAQYQGSGSVTLSMGVVATSRATGGGNLVTSMVTTAMGQASITYRYTPSNALKPGNYVIVQTAQPPGFLDGKESKNGTVLPGSVGTDTIAVTLAGSNLPNNNFGELQASGLSGYVYVDANNNGVKEPGEAGIGGAIVTLTGANELGAVNVAASTNSDGAYSFGGLRPGTYTITETQPASYFDGKDAVGSAGGTLGADQITSITLPAGTLGSNYNFGEVLPASLSGFVYMDANNNGVKDQGEAGIGGATVSLSGTNDLSAAVNIALTTNSDGSYLFNLLRPGTYSIAESQPTGFLDGKDVVGSAGGTIGNDQVNGIVLAMSAAGSNYNFGELAPAQLSGSVFIDLNANCKVDAGEQPIAGATIQLTGTDDKGSVSRTAQTGADGSYRFDNLRPGTYTLTEFPLADYLDGPDCAGALGGAVVNDSVSGIVVPVGGQGNGYNFGEFVPASVSGFVYLDANNNGVKDSGEQAIVGVVLTLTGASDQGAVTATTQTGQDGGYSFPKLRPGTYTVAQAHPIGYLDGRETAGSAGGQAGNDAITGIVLAANTQAANYNFGELLPASLAGFVYLDANDNGTRDSGESGLAGVSVSISGTNDLGVGVNLTVVTAVDGSYLFANLRPSTYAVTESHPSGYLDGRDSVGSIGGTVVNDQIGGINLAMGVAGANYNFGEVTPASLAGMVFVDNNNNGQRDANESGLPGVSLSLTGTNDAGSTSLTIKTNNDGAYLFADLRPGVYKLMEVQPPVYLDGRDSAGSLGGALGADQVVNITVPMGEKGTGYNFAELWPGYLAGFVYVDANVNNVRDAGDSGIANVTVTLQGTDDLGAAVNMTRLTGADGSYSFSPLRPGTYTIVETQPAGYQNKATTAGSLGGAAGTNRISAINQPVGGAGTEYNFGEVIPSSQILAVFDETFAFTGPGFSKVADLPVLSKGLFLAQPYQSELDPTTAAQAIFIDGVYRNVLNRGVDGNGLVYWMQALNGQSSRSEIVAKIWNSAEHRGIQVDKFYTTFLHRAPDAGRAYWIHLMVAGASEQQVARMFLGSAEYQALHVDNVSFLSGVYADLLGRPMEAAGMAYWQQALQNGATRDQVAQIVMNSPEAHSRILQSAYANYLHRSIDQGGKAYWISLLQSNQITPQGASISILASDEYFALATEASKVK